MALTKKQAAVVAKLGNRWKTAPWVLRITENKNIAGPVLVIKERYTGEDGVQKLREYGRIYNGDLRACKDAINYMLNQVLDEDGNSFNIGELIDNKVEFRGNIPLDKVIGTKMALLFKLHPQIHKESRTELLAWRIERFTFEESMYWLGKVSIPTYGKRSMEWAKSGLRLMLSGKAEDQESIEELLVQLRK